MMVLWKYHNYETRVLFLLVMSPKLRPARFYTQKHESDEDIIPCRPLLMLGFQQCIVMA